MNPTQEKNDIDHIERVLKSDKVNLILTIISYCLLIFTTFFVGFDLFKGIRVWTPLGWVVVTQKKSNTIATVLLLVVWIIFLSITSLKLKNL